MQRFIAATRQAAAASVHSHHAASAAAAVRHFTAAAAPIRPVRRATPIAQPRMPLTPAVARISPSAWGGVSGWVGARSMSSAAATPSAGSEAATTVAETAKRLAELNFSPPLDPTSSFRFLHFIPESLRDLLTFVHDSLPAEFATTWIPTIAITTVILRLAIFPIAVKQQKNAAGLSLMRPELEELNERHRAIEAKYTVAGLAMPFDERLRQSVEKKALFKKYDCSVGTTLAMPFVLMPMFISMFTALRTMGWVDESFLTGGVAWFENLGQLDRGWHDLALQLGPLRLSMGLPLVNAALIALTIKTNADGDQSASVMAAGMRKIMYAFALLAWPMCSSGIPAGVLVYWCFSNVFSMAQAALLRSDFGRRVFKIPKVTNTAKDMDKSWERLQAMWGQAKAAKQAQNTQAAINPFEQPRSGASAPATPAQPVHSPQDFYRRKKKSNK